MRLRVEFARLPVPLPSRCTANRTLPVAPFLARGYLPVLGRAVDLHPIGHYSRGMLSFCGFFLRTDKRNSAPCQNKSKTFLPCHRGRCAATCSAHEHTKLATISSGRKGTRRHRHERPHAPHAMRLRSARRDGRAGQAGAEVPHLLARCAACVSAGAAQGRTRAGIISLAKCSRLAFTVRVRSRVLNETLRGNPWTPA